jgi:competence protein ComEA
MTDIVNLNSADKEKLQKLPGIGPAMADRIIENRPYKKVEDLLKVSGVGPALLESFASQVTVSQVEEELEDEDIIYLGPEPEATTLGPTEADLSTPDEIEEQEAPISEDGLELEEADEIEQEVQTLREEDQEEKVEETDQVISKEKAIVPLKNQEEIESEPKKKPKPLTWGNALLIATICSFISFILAVLLSLGILGSLNNGLRYATADQGQAISTQIESLNNELKLLNEDLTGLRSRLDNLESLSGRVGEIELEAEQLTTDMAAVTDEISAVKTQIAEFTESAERFQTFINGLADLLDTLNVEQIEVP